MRHHRPQYRYHKICIVEVEVRVQLQCCVNDLASQAVWHGCSATGYGQCFHESSQLEGSGACIKATHRLEGIRIRVQ